MYVYLWSLPVTDWGLYIFYYLTKSTSIHFFLHSRNVAKELGAEIPGKPLVFLKPTTTYITEGQEIRVRMYTLSSVSYFNIRHNC